MKIGIYGKKIGMTQIFNNQGDSLPVTVLKIYNNQIIDIKNKKDCLYILTGTNFLNIIKQKNIKNSVKLFFKKINYPFFNKLKEYKIDSKNNFNLKIGDIFGIERFKIGEKLKINGISSGKGNQGNIKRNNFKRGPMSHGSKHHRLQGSLGAGTTPGRVFPGKKMPGRTGNQKVTISGIEIVDICNENNLLAIKGSIPGKFGNLIEIIKI